MKLYNVNAKEFMNLLDHAKGNIYLQTDDGDKINLKSKLAQLLGLKILLDMANDASMNVELTLDDPADETMFLDYLINKKQPE